jgi:hypothetical protein
MGGRNATLGRSSIRELLVFKGRSRKNCDSDLSQSRCPYVTGDAVRSLRVSVALLRTVFIIEIAAKQAPYNKGNVEHCNAYGKVGEVVYDRR